MRMLLVLLAPALLTACGGEGDGTAISINANSADGAIKATAGKDGSIAIDAPGFKGSFNLPGIKLDAGNFDLDGVKLPPESSIVAMNLNSQGNGREGDGLTLRFRTPQEAVAVRTWFADRLKTAGYTLTATGDALKGTTGEGQPFSLTTRAAGPGASESTIVVGG